MMGGVFSGLFAMERRELRIRCVFMSRERSGGWSRAVLRFSDTGGLLDRQAPPSFTTNKISPLATIGAGKGLLSCRFNLFAIECVV